MDEEPDDGEALFFLGNLTEEDRKRAFTPLTAKQKKRIEELREEHRLEKLKDIKE